jgi:hypothetical protein
MDKQTNVNDAAHFDGKRSFAVVLIMAQGQNRKRRTGEKERAGGKKKERIASTLVSCAPDRGVLTADSRSVPDALFSSLFT